MSEQKARQWDLPQPVFIEVEVASEHIDASGHVDNAIYPSWMNDCAWHHSRNVGIGPDLCKTLDAGMAALRTQIEYMLPPFEGERLLVGNWTPIAMTAYERPADTRSCGRPIDQLFCERRPSLSALRCRTESRAGCQGSLPRHIVFYPQSLML